MRSIHQLVAATFAVSLVTVAGLTNRIPKATMRNLPDGLKIGVATAAFQIEGGWDAADKSPSIWDTYSRIPGNIADGADGNDTCKSYEYYQRDIEMLKFLGVDFYRFSISWPRVLPTGFANKISEEGIAYYSKLVDELLANGIEPVATLYHWDLPQSLQDLGGWANPLIVDWFEDYARVMFDALGDRVKSWITINEPRQFAIYGYGMDYFAPSIISPGIGDYMAIKNSLLAHARAWHLYDKEYRHIQKGTCGITIATDFCEGATDSAEDIETGELAMDFEIGTSDFFGFNHYSTSFYTESTYKSGMYPVPSHNDDIGAVSDHGPYVTSPSYFTTSIPVGIRKSLNWVKDKYDNPQIMIYENGFGSYGSLGLDDPARIDYHYGYLNSVLDAIEIDGCNITRYTAWSLMDNFEWRSGLSVKFGLFEVDFDDEMRTRKPKTSALWYRNLIASRTLNPDDNPQLEYIVF
uniref:Beta-glucosidase n=1 Tax=Heliothis virescens TaxID=7102 RepID=A0A2A4JEY2_HELVI